MATEKPIDLFEWANKTDAFKKDLNVELFLFNKYFTPYATNISDEVVKELLPAFLYDAINEVTLGAGTGLVVRDLEYLDKVTKNDNVIFHESLEKVGRAETLIHLIENERDDILYFNDREHEFKRMKGMIARFRQTNSKDSFYIAKQIEQSKVVNGVAWQFNNDTIEKLQPEVTFKVPLDNQTLIVGKDIFIYNQTKFEKLFNYDFVKLQQADVKATQFEKKFKISMPGDLAGLGNILRESSALLNKFLKTDIDLVTQEQVIEIADTMQIEIMSDDAGAIIVMDKSDLNVMLDIMNDNYFQSEATGNHYVAKSKKVIEVADDQN